LTLPLHLTSAEFEQACRDLRAALGEAFVRTSEDQLEPYFDPYSPGLRARFAPAAAVLPANVAGIQAVLAIAHGAQLPLWTVSLGRNYAYGGAAPCLAGSVILDLSRMQTIEVDSELAYAIVEPGVTFLQLYKFIRDKNYPLMIDCPDPGWGSVLGNTLERGVGYTPHGDHAAQQCGMEVVLASGEVLRTGMGAMTDNPAWALYKGAFGPSLDGLFFQSNLGIVTKIGVWLMPEPEAISVVEASFPREEDIVPLVDILRRLRLAGTVPTATIANWMRIAAGNSTRAEWYDGKGAMPPSAIETLVRKMEIGHWNLRFGLYGTRRYVEENFRLVVKAFSSVEGAQITRANYARGQEILPHHRTLAGIPSVDFMSLNWLGGMGAHIECPPVVPMQGADVLALYRRRTALFNAHGFDHYCGLTSTTPRAFINTGSIIFDSEDTEQAEQARALGAALIEDAGKIRLGGYRAHIAEMDLVAAQFDFGEHVALRIYERLKDLLDPDGILSPGKQGVWPKRLRETKDREPDAQ
jgi:4-cresol dehydrogenase (hydroxylating)